MDIEEYLYGFIQEFLTIFFRLTFSKYHLLNYIYLLKSIKNLYIFLFEEKKLLIRILYVFIDVFKIIPDWYNLLLSKVI